MALLYPSPNRTPCVLSEDELRGTVRSAAVQFVLDLGDAERSTGSWDNAELGCALVDEAMTKCLSRLADTGCWGRCNQVASHEVWSVAGELLKSGWLQFRAREKPLGYAGDCELLSAIIEQRCCKHPLGRHFDRYFLNQAAPRAVGCRTEMIASTLAVHCHRSQASPYQILSVGVGAGIDIERGTRPLPAKRRGEVRVNLVDLDEDAPAAWMVKELRPWTNHSI